MNQNRNHILIMRLSVCFQSSIKKIISLKTKFYKPVLLIAKNTKTEHKQNLFVSNKISFTGISVKNIFV